MSGRWLAAAACIPLAGCCASNGTCGWKAYGPNPTVAFRSMVVRCRPHGGVADWHSVVMNPGALAAYGQDDFTCRDGAAGVSRWDTQAPGGDNAP